VLSVLMNKARRSWVPSIRAVLEGRENAALVRVEELRAKLVRVRAALAEAEEVLHHRALAPRRADARAHSRSEFRAFLECPEVVSWPVPMTLYVQRAERDR
jgi:hypothetical protein